METDDLDFRLGESESQAFVQNLENAAEIARTLTAFANTCDGKLIVGLKSNGKVTGIFPDEELDRLKNIILAENLHLNYETKILAIGFRFVLIIYVEKSNTRPHFSRNELGKKEACIRVGKQNIPANKILLSTWKYENATQPTTLSPDEYQLIELIKENSNISLTQIYKKSQIPINIVDYSLVRLINWNIIEIKTTEKGCFFGVQQ